ncbi:hypothetical protein [Salarchaeum japonicum]|uniref:Uncharacterized protein n=1 Tax=Salarchaeum japonicum TaxID=555573 RepID=A0AAV3T1J3_9EURY|nr:hypothetical protein [Salarchaeum japonicum]
MVSLSIVAAGLGLVVAAAAFLRLADSDETDAVHLVVLEYGFAFALLIAGFGLIVIEMLT